MNKLGLSLKALSRLRLLDAEHLDIVTFPNQISQMAKDNEMFATSLEAVTHQPPARLTASTPPPAMSQLCMMSTLTALYCPVCQIVSWT